MIIQLFVNGIKLNQLSLVEIDETLCSLLNTCHVTVLVKEWGGHHCCFVIGTEALCLEEYGKMVVGETMGLPNGPH